MRINSIITICAITALLLISCSSAGPTVPIKQDLARPVGVSANGAEPWIWGNWQMYIPADHSGIEILPVRSTNKHYNVKTLLEQAPCDNCLWVSKFQNNGDGTISIDVTIRHPYPTNDYFTGFDVRGIVYTSTHYFFIDPTDPDPLLVYHFPALEMGDLDVLNPDGYTGAFSPFRFKTESPIFKYQPGGDLGGTFDENDEEFSGYKQLWPFKCYYSSENRRYFATNAVLTQTYHIALPPGEWEFGYSVDASWAPPTNVPVTDIETDFPPQANSLYHYRVDMEISEPLFGFEPSYVTIRVYNHLPEAVELYQFSDVDLYINTIEGGKYSEHPEGPTFVCDEYVMFEYGLVNELQRPPGRYPILAYIHLSDDDYLDNIEEKWWRNAGCHQVLWVTVAE